jgi:hypothetical protein
MNPRRMSEREGRQETRAIQAFAVIILVVLVVMGYQYFFG